MTVRRRASIRGSIARGDAGPTKPPRRGPMPPPEVVPDPARPRAVIDFSLEKRREVLAMHRGRALDSSACEADTYLLRAAKYHGEEAGRPCPICKDPALVTVTYVYGDELGPYSGRVRQTAELTDMSRRFGSFKVYVVEVCQRCHWNFLTMTYVLGDGIPRRAIPSIET